MLLMFVIIRFSIYIILLYIEWKKKMVGIKIKRICVKKINKNVNLFKKDKTWSHCVGLVEERDVFLWLVKKH